MNEPDTTSGSLFLIRLTINLTLFRLLSLTESENDIRAEFWQHAFDVSWPIVGHEAHFRVLVFSNINCDAGGKLGFLQLRNKELINL